MVVLKSNERTYPGFDILQSELNTIKYITLCVTIVIIIYVFLKLNVIFKFLKATI